jgi:hypothetical protein
MAKLHSRYPSSPLTKKKSKKIDQNKRDKRKERPPNQKTSLFHSLGREAVLFTRNIITADGFRSGLFFLRGTTQEEAT